jgi:hypothetical protein
MKRMDLNPNTEGAEDAQSRGRVSEWQIGDVKFQGRRPKASKLANDFETVRQMAAGEDFAARHSGQVRALEMGSARLQLQIQLYHAGQEPSRCAAVRGDVKLRETSKDRRALSPMKPGTAHPQNLLAPNGWAARPEIR